MIFQMYVVLNIQTQEYSMPFFQKNDTLATRAFIDSLKEQKYPKDFKLFKVGNFSITSAQFQTYEPTEEMSTNEVENE